MRIGYCICTVLSAIVMYVVTPYIVINIHAGILTVRCCLLYIDFGRVLGTYFSVS